MRDGPHDRARREHAPCKPQREDQRGCERRVGRATTGATRHAPPPPSRGTGAAPRACAVLVSCLPHACNEGMTTRLPPHTHTSAPRRVGDEGREGRTAPPPPPEYKAARRGGSGERVRDGSDDRARRKQAPCKPQRGGHRGCERRVGRVTTGARRQAPPPCRGTSAAPRACAVLATCLRRRTDSEDAPPPTPFSSTHPRKGRGQRGDSEGTSARAEDRPKRRGEGRVVSGRGKKKQRTPTRQSRNRQQGQTGHGRSQEARQGARERGTPLGKKARRQGPTLQQTGGGRGDKSPQKTLVRYPTSRVCPPPPRVRIGPT